jgi:pyruvate,orthophosphate dikinase
MVLGNMGDTSSRGFAFTINPTTGEKIFFGEYLINVKGKDVVTGIRTPQQISNAGKDTQGSDLPSMEKSKTEM